tara:strand:- start:163 stop:330 length:168 start_codon:yes stop_codon:yes gene_type:complete
MKAKYNKGWQCQCGKKYKMMHEAEHCCLFKYEKREGWYIFIAVTLVTIFIIMVAK